MSKAYRIAQVQCLIIAFGLVCVLDNTRGIFWVVFAATVLNLILMLLQRPAYLRLAMVWQAGILVIFVPEGLLFADRMINEAAGADNLLTAARYIALCAIGFLLVYSCSFSESKVKRDIKAREVNDNSVAMSARPTFATKALLITMYAAFLATGIPAAYLGLQGGRAAFAQYQGQQLGAVGSQIAGLIGLALPALISSYYRILRRDRRALSKSIIAAVPVLVVLFAIGTRFYLLFSVSGLFFVNFGRAKLNLKLAARIAVVVAILGFGAEVMHSTRGLGILSESAGPSVGGNIGVAEALVSYENVTPTMSMLVDYFRHNDHMWGLSSSTLLVFWIPRSIWPSKPTFLGYWFIRQYESSRSVGRGHSVSLTFAGDAYADFGFLGGVLFWALLGYPFALLERWTATHIQRHHEWGTRLAAAFLYPTVFFSVRSLNTAALVAASAMAVFCLLRLTIRVTRAPSNVEEPTLAPSGYLR